MNNIDLTLFHDSGMLPYNSYLRVFLYKLFPKQIKYIKKGVKLNGKIIVCTNNSRPFLISDTEKFVIGNIYKMSDEAIKFFCSIFGCGIESVKIGEDQIKTFKLLQGLVSWKPQSNDFFYVSIRDFAIKNKGKTKLKFLYEEDVEEIK
jgi:hypothetical protein